MTTAEKVRKYLRLEHVIIASRYWLVHSGGSRISKNEGAKPEGSANLLFGDFFPENCMKIKEIGSRGGARL